MKKIIIILLLIPALMFSLSPESKQTIKKALLLYRAMHSGNYKIMCTSSSVTNNMNVLQITITAASNIFKGEMHFPIQKSLDRKNYFNFLIGNIIGVQYGRKIFGNIILNAGFSIYEKNNIMYIGVGINL